MNLYVITNGWIGESYLRVVALAPDDETALELARAQFQLESGDHGSSYWNDLAIEHKQLSITMPWVSKVFDS